METNLSSIDNRNQVNLNLIDIFKSLDEKCAPYKIFMNIVAGMKNHGGHYFEAIRTICIRLGYDRSWVQKVHNKLVRMGLIIIIRRRHEFASKHIHMSNLYIINRKLWNDFFVGNPFTGKALQENEAALLINPYFIEDKDIKSKIQLQDIVGSNKDLNIKFTRARACEENTKDKKVKQETIQKELTVVTKTEPTRQRPSMAYRNILASREERAREIAREYCRKNNIPLPEHLQQNDQPVTTTPPQQSLPPQNILNLDIQEFKNLTNKTPEGLKTNKQYSSDFERKKAEYLEANERFLNRFNTFKKI